MSYNKFTGRKSSIGTTAVRLTSTETDRPTIGTQIFADSGNSGVLYVGFSNAITTDSADSTDGFPLAAGASILIHNTKPYDIWVKASSGSGNKAFFIGV